MACKIAFRSLGNTLTTPGNQDIFWKSGIWIFDPNESKLYPAVRKVFDEVNQFTLW